MSLFIKEIVSFLKCLSATAGMALLMSLLMADSSKGNLNSLPPVSLYVLMAVLGALFLWWQNRERRLNHENEHIQALTNKGHCKKCGSADLEFEDLDCLVATVKCQKCGHGVSHWIPDV